MSFFNRFGKEQKKEKKAAPKAETLKEKKPSEQIKEKAAAKRDIGKTSGILVKPFVTEKASFIGQYGQYVFEVVPKANKVEIAKAIWNTYGVKPLNVNVLRVRGKETRYGRTSGRTKDRKKAIITLKPGEKIEVHEGV